MALVCDKSTEPGDADKSLELGDTSINEDLEDGEIEDDEEIAATNEEVPEQESADHPASPKYFNNKGRYERPRADDRKRGHLTEAEKSVMHLHKLERIEREKREKYKREQTTAAVDDFASNIEKAIASILKKDKPEDEAEEPADKRSRKRKKKDKDKKKAKQRKLDLFPDFEAESKSECPSPLAYSDSGSNSSVDRKHNKKTVAEMPPKGRDHSKKKHQKLIRDAKTENQLKPVEDGVCLFYLQGRCNSGDNCMFSHHLDLPTKLELCKFYVLGCCAKGENCSYMHSSFPCKFYHMGIVCQAGDLCKYAHGKPLNDGLKQILFKHIETAPKEILGDFPRLSRENALVMLNQAQKTLDGKYGGEKAEMPGGVSLVLEGSNDFGDSKKDKKERSRPSRWQDPEPSETLDTFGLTGFYTECGDQDMRITSNGDIDMRTLPSQLTTLLQNVSSSMRLLEPSADKDTLCLPSADTDIRFEPPLAFQSTEHDCDFPPNLPKKQRELFLRIQSHQKDNIVESETGASFDEDKNIDWYSEEDDDDDERLMIEDPPKKTEEPAPIQDVEPVEVLEKLGDLSKIDISLEVSKLLSSLKGGSSFVQPANDEKKQAVDPRKHAKDPEKSEVKKTEKLSIYEQGSMSLDGAAKDVDLREDVDLRIGRDFDLRSSLGRPDIDLRNLGLPFKPMQNYTPATEIDASIQSHQPIQWRVQLIEIPQPNYTGLKLSAHDAKSDPRLRKIFRLSAAEESPASPKETTPAISSPPVARTDPRLRKTEEKSSSSSGPLNYSQQLNVLQASAFYQSLTSSQKLLLNQELTDRVENTTASDPVLNGILSNLGLISGANSTVIPSNTAANTNALNILANVNNQPFNPAVLPPSNLGVANLPSDFQLNFDPRQGGLLGNAPPFSFNENSGPFNNGGGNYEDYYEEHNGRGGGRGGGFRGRQHQQNRRGRGFNNRRNGGRNFRSRNRNNANNVKVNNNRDRGAAI